MERVRLVLLAGTLAVLSCNAGGDTPAAYSSLEEGCHSAFAVYNRSVTKCASTFISGDDWSATYNLEPFPENTIDWLCGALSEAYSPSVDRGSIAIDLDALSQCVARLDSGAGCSLPFLMGGVTDIAATCRAVKGNVAVGAECVIRGECMAGAWCDFSSGCPGTCVGSAAEGERCRPSIAESCLDPDRFICSSERCIPARRSADDCGNSSECLPGLICVEKKCRETMPDNGKGTCGAEGSDVLRMCAVGHECVREADGAVCRRHAELGENCVRVECEPDLSCQGGICVQSLAAGDACSIDSFEGICAPGYFCLESRCQKWEPRANGQSCPNGNWCESGACVEGICRSASDIGTAFACKTTLWWSSSGE